MKAKCKGCGLRTREAEDTADGRCLQYVMGDLKEGRKMKFHELKLSKENDKRN